MDEFVSALLDEIQRLEFVEEMTVEDLEDFLKAAAGSARHPGFNYLYDPFVACLFDCLMDFS